MTRYLCLDLGYTPGRQVWIPVVNQSLVVQASSHSRAWWLWAQSLKVTLPALPLPRFVIRGKEPSFFASLFPHLRTRNNKSTYIAQVASLGNRLREGFTMQEMYVRKASGIHTCERVRRQQKQAEREVA